MGSGREERDAMEGSVKVGGEVSGAKRRSVRA